MKIKYNYLAYFVILVFIFGSLAAPNSELNETNMSNKNIGDLNNSNLTGDFSNSSVNYQTTVRTDAPNITEVVIDWNSVNYDLYYSTYNDDNIDGYEKVRIGGNMRAEYTGGIVEATFNLQINSSVMGIVQNSNYSQVRYGDNYFGMSDIYFMANHSATYNFTLNFYLNGNYTGSESRSFEMNPSGYQTFDNEYTEVFQSRIDSRVLGRCYGDQGNINAASHNSDCTGYPDAAKYDLSAEIYPYDWDEARGNGYKLEIGWEIFAERSDMFGITGNVTLFEGYKLQESPMDVNLYWNDMVWEGTFDSNGTYYFKTTLLVNDVIINEKIEARYLYVLEKEENLDVDIDLNDEDNDNLVDTIEWEWEYQSLSYDNYKIEVQLQDSNNITLQSESQKLFNAFNYWFYDEGYFGDLEVGNYTVVVTLFRNGDVHEEVRTPVEIEDKFAYHDLDLDTDYEYDGLGLWDLRFYVEYEGVSDNVSLELLVSLYNYDTGQLMDEFDIPLNTDSMYFMRYGYTYTHMKVQLPNYNMTYLFNATLNAYEGELLLASSEDSYDYEMDSNYGLDEFAGINLEMYDISSNVWSDEGLVYYEIRFAHWMMDENSKLDLHIETIGDVNETLASHFFDLKGTDVIRFSDYTFMPFNGSVAINLVLHFTDSNGEVIKAEYQLRDKRYMEANPSNFYMSSLNDNYWNENNCYNHIEYRLYMTYKNLVQANLTVMSEFIHIDQLSKSNDTAQNHTISSNWILDGSSYEHQLEMPVVIDFEGRYQLMIYVYLDDQLVYESDRGTKDFCSNTNEDLRTYGGAYFDEYMGYMYTYWGMDEGFVGDNTPIKFELNYWFMNEFSNNYIMVEHSVRDWVLSGNLNSLDWHERPRADHRFSFMYVGSYLYDITITVGDKVIDRTVFEIEITEVSMGMKMEDSYLDIDLETWDSDIPDVIRFNYGLCCEILNIFDYVLEIDIKLLDEDLNEFISIASWEVHPRDRGYGDFWNEEYFFVQETGEYLISMQWVGPDGENISYQELRSYLTEFNSEEYGEDGFYAYGYMYDACCGPNNLGARLQFEVEGYSNKVQMVDLAFTIRDRYGGDIVLKDQLSLMVPEGPLNIWDEFFIPLDFGEYFSTVLVYVDGVLHRYNTNSFEVREENQYDGDMGMSDPPQLSAFADKYEMESNEYLKATFEIKDSTSGMIDIAVNGESIFMEQYYFDTQAILTLGSLVDGMYNVSISLDNSKGWYAMFWFMVKVGDGGVNTTDPTDPTDPTETSDPTDPTETSSSETNSTETAGNETSQDVPQTGGVTNAPSLPISFLWIVIPLLAIPVLRRK